MVLSILMKLCTISFSVASMDYSQNTPVTLKFEMCDMTLCHSIPIVDDNVPEGNETFYVTLEGTADMDRNRIILDPADGTIEIIDDELACKQVLYLDTDSCIKKYIHLKVTYSIFVAVYGM